MTIELYNESNVDSRSIILTNSVGTVSTMVGVEFSHPSGIFRLNQFTNATHFKATFAGVEYVYRITGFTAINNGVCEYSYTLDFLKDYFLKNLNAFIRCGGFVTRSTREALWDKFSSDDMILSTGKITVQNSATNVSIGSNFRYILVIKGAVDEYTAPYVMYSCPKSTMKALYHHASYMFSQKSLEEPTIQELLNKHITAFNEIVAIYVVPEDFGTGNEESVQFPIRREEAVQEYTSLSGVTGKRISNFKNVHSYTLPNFTYEDFRDRDYKKVKVYAPFAGMIDIPVDYFTTYNGTTHAIQIRYNYNLIDGTVGLSWMHNGIELPCSIAVSQLPQMPIPSSQYTSNIYKEALNYSNNILSSMNNTAASLTTGVMSGALIGGGVGAIIGGIASTTLGLTTNLINAGNTHKMNLNAINTNATPYNGVASGFSGLQNADFVYQTTTIETIFTPEIYGYVVNKPLSDITALLPDTKYWIDLSTANIGGPKWYAEGVKADIGNDYIVYH